MRSTRPTTSELAPTSRFDPTQWRSIAGMAGFVVLLHVLGWGSLILLVGPAHYALGGSAVFGIGLGLTAYTLGMRHAFDADHIAAIDNTTRKLISDGERPVSVGFWFSLGHSSVVFGLCLLLAFGVRAFASQVADNSSTLQSATGIIGTAVSGVFLIVIGIVNLVVLRQVVTVFQRLRDGDYDEAELEAQLSKRGFLNRILGGVTKTVSKPAHMYPVGLLFGLGFDTATEVSLLVLAGGAAASALPWYAILTLPVLFTAGMCLLDSIDGAFMNVAYGWANAQPVRKVFYNITVTALSVAVALVIGGIELIGLLADKLGVESGPVGWIASIDLDNIGFAIVGVFALTWIVAIVVWKGLHIEDRWGPEPRS